MPHRVAAPGESVDGGPAVVGAEILVTAAEVRDVEFLVHGVRLPCQEDDPVLPPGLAVDLGQHALLARRHQFPVAEIEGAFLDHPVDVGVGGSAGIDAVDLAVELVGEAAEIGDVVRQALVPFCADGRCNIAGPPIRIMPQTAVSLSLAMHELATNAAKYGALSVETGRVRVAWRRIGEDVELVWEEIGGPAFHKIMTYLLQKYAVPPTGSAPPDTPLEW